MSERKPLTMEELRQMVDKPAYLDVFDKALQSGWHIIKAVTKDKIIFRGWNTVYVPVEAMGKDYNLYASEPPRLDRSAWEPCEHCKPSKNPLDRWGPHQFPIDGNEIYCYDTDDGWEGEEINFCPWCGRPLTDAAWDMLERRLAGRE